MEFTKSTDTGSGGEFLPSGTEEIYLGLKSLEGYEVVMERAFGSGQVGPFVCLCHRPSVGSGRGQIFFSFYLSFSFCKMSSLD